MAQYTLEHGQRNLIPTLKTVQWGLGIGGWCADLLNMQKNGMWWARVAQPGFLLMCNIYRSYIGILLQEMWHAPIKENIAISVKYYTVFSLQFCPLPDWGVQSFILLEHWSHLTLAENHWAHCGHTTQLKLLDNVIWKTKPSTTMLHEPKWPLLIYGQKWSLQMYTGFHSMLHYSQSTLWAHYEHRRTIRDYSEPQRERGHKKEHKRALYVEITMTG